MKNLLMIALVALAAFNFVNKKSETPSLQNDTVIAAEITHRDRAKRQAELYLAAREKVLAKEITNAIELSRFLEAGIVDINKDIASAFGEFTASTLPSGKFDEPEKDLNYVADWLSSAASGFQRVSK